MTRRKYRRLPIGWRITYSGYGEGRSGRPDGGERDKETGGKEPARCAAATAACGFARLTARAGRTARTTPRDCSRRTGDTASSRRRARCADRARAVPRFPSRCRRRAAARVSGARGARATPRRRERASPRLSPGSRRKAAPDPSRRVAPRGSGTARQRAGGLWHRVGGRVAERIHQAHGGTDRSHSGGRRRGAGRWGDMADSVRFVPGRRGGRDATTAAGRAITSIGEL